MVSTGICAVYAFRIFKASKEVDNFKSLSLKEKIAFTRSEVKHTTKYLLSSMGLTDIKARKKEIADFKSINSEIKKYLKSNDDILSRQVQYALCFNNNILPEQIQSLEEEQKQVSSELVLVYDMLYPMYNEDEVMEVGEERKTPRLVRRIK